MNNTIKEAPISFSKEHPGKPGSSQNFHVDGPSDKETASTCSWNPSTSRGHCKNSPEDRHASPTPCIHVTTSRAFQTA